MKTAIARVALTLAAGLAASGAWAQDNIVKLGATLYDSNSRTTGIKGVGVPPGADAVVGDATTAIIVFERTLDPNVSVELVLGVPPKVRARAAGSVAFLGDNVLSARNIAPTLFVNYAFGAAGSSLRPYLGAGLNYTRFGSISSPLAPKVEMSDSLGLALVAGVNYALDRQWGLFASVARVDVSSNLVATGATVLTTTIDFRPTVYSVGTRYRF